MVSKTIFKEKYECWAFQSCVCEYFRHNKTYNIPQIVTPIFNNSNSMSLWKQNYPIFSLTSINRKNRFTKSEIFVDTASESSKFILYGESTFGYHHGTPQYKICISDSYIKCEKSLKFSFSGFEWCRIVPRVVSKILESKKCDVSTF